VASGARPIVGTSRSGKIPDLRGSGLRQLADRAAAGEKAVTGVVSRTVDGQKGVSAVPAMMFNSTI
jgi:hypothetical protein